MAAAVGGIVVGLGMALGVDLGVYARIPRIVHGLYLYTLMGLLILGPLSGIGLVFWFAHGRPDRQLG